jgi:hypothetical protein
MKGLTPMKSNAIVTKIDDFVTCLDHSIYDLPARKFTREFLAAMLVAKSTLISEICRAVTCNKKSFAALYQKFWRRLSEVNFADAKRQQQQRAFREITDDSVIAVDLGDITKPHATAMEGLALVADGSDDHKIKPGYWTIGAVAVNPKSEDKTPQPLELNVYSAVSEGFVSENTIINNFIADLFHQTNGKGIFTIDRGADRLKILQPLCELGCKFIVRMNCRHLTDADDPNLTIKINNHVARRSDLPYGASLERRTRNGKRVPMRLRFSFTKVKIPGLKKKRVDHNLTLITAWSDKAKKPIEILTSIPVETAGEAVQAIINYLSRWSVEETYRFLKTDSKLEKVQLRSLGKLENMIAACFLAASIVARMARVPSWQRKFEQISRRQKPAPDSLYNWMYRAADAVSHVLKREFAAIRKLNEPRPPGRRKPPQYLGLIPLEFGL